MPLKPLGVKLVKAPLPGDLHGRSFSREVPNVEKSNILVSLGVTLANSSQMCPGTLEVNVACCDVAG